MYCKYSKRLWTKIENKQTTAHGKKREAGGVRKKEVKCRNLKKKKENRKFVPFDITSCLKSAEGETVRSWNAPFAETKSAKSVVKIQSHLLTGKAECDM